MIGRTLGMAARVVRVVASTAVVLVGLLALLILWRLRPALPDLPSSLSSPVTSYSIQQLVLMTVWLLSGVVVLVLLVHSIIALVALGPRPTWAPERDLVERAPVRRRSAPQRPGFPPPFPIVPRGRAESWRNSDRPTQEPTADTARPPAQASLSLLGPLDITPSKRRGRGLRSRTQEFLVYLALRREGATTDELASALWPEIVDADAARRSVWRSASEARSRLGEAVIHVGDRYLLDRRKVEVDLDRFNALLAEAAMRSGIDRAELLEQACALVRGDPLAGIDASWADGETRHLRAVVAGLFQQLAKLRLLSNPAAALAAAEEAIALDPYAESAQRLAMRAEAALGLREAVMARYEGLRRELDTKLGLEPERETRQLYRRLLSQDAGVSPSQPPPESPPDRRRASADALAVD